MSQATRIEPDLGFIKDIVAKGGDTLKNCYQCASCSVVCNLSPDDRPFPRKEMIWAQWGLKDHLTRDPDVWLCHQCNDCSKHCPRGARPGDVLAALRQMTIIENAFPRFLAKWVSDPKFLPVIFAVPVALLLICMWAVGTLRIPEGTIVYTKFIPQWPVVDPLFILTAIWAVICSAVGIRRFWVGFSGGAPEGTSGDKPTIGEFISKQALPVIIDILTHNNFKECEVNRPRYLSHLGTTWGFILLFITTTFVATGVYILGKQTPYSLANPIKWIGNIGAIILIVGCILAFANWLSKEEDTGKATYADWLFLWVVLITGITGLLCEILRLGDAPGVAYPMYFIHLVFVWFLFAYFPFSKFAHLAYRTTAMVYARSMGRQLKKGTTVISYEGSRADQGETSEAKEEKEKEAVS
jgi:quinone-modifying oxidoreductase subunit QmoC